MNKTQVIILGAGKPHFGNKASAIVNISKNKNTLNFILNLLKKYNCEIQFISGLNYKKIKKEFSNIKIHYNKDWKYSGPIFSLSKANLSNKKDLIIIYSDILFRENLLSKILNSKSNLAIACDKNYKNRYLNRDPLDYQRAEKIIFDKKDKFKFSYNKTSKKKTAEILGLVKIKKKKIPELKRFLLDRNKHFNKLKLSDLLNYLTKKVSNIEIIDSKGDWSEINNHNDISNFILGTKSNTLLRLKNILKKSIILDQVQFNQEDWKYKRKEIINKIQKKYKNKTLIVRSSSKEEDNKKKSNAGKFLSVLNINSKKKLIDSIARVFRSYKSNKNNEIFIQEQFSDSEYVGVITTKSKENGSPWYVINFEKTKNTEVITKGDTNTSKTIYFRRDANIKDINNKSFYNLINAVKEIENLLQNYNLDIEFAINNKNKVYIFQIRPLVLDIKKTKVSSNLYKIYKKAEKKYLNYVLGSNLRNQSLLVFGVMPDWNPAEIIGFKPSRLSLSLYEKLITNKVWAKQREEFGYRKIIKKKLLETFGGTPYVCVNKSLESFIPSKLKKKLAEKILNISLKILKNDPSKHDKIEFQVIPNCFDFNFYKWKKIYLNEGIKKNEIKIIENNLKNINSKSQKIFIENLKKIEKNELTYSKNNIYKKFSIIKLLQVCEDNHTLVFSHFARCAFISVIVLKSALENKKITTREYNNFFNSIETISKTFQVDANKFNDNKVSKKIFIEKYGHLRPRTYDITSTRYDENLSILINKSTKKNKLKKIKLQGTRIFNKKFYEELRNIGFKGSDEEIFNFLKGSIEKREYSKFIFTKYLSDALELIKNKFKMLNINPQDVSLLNIKNIIDFVNKKISIKEIKRFINKNFIEDKQKNSCEMPKLIFSKNNFKLFELEIEEPNFIGEKIIFANTIFIKNFKKNLNLMNQIVVIDSADPGYDWIFNYNIKGLITKYGGVNSHMSIRCAELNLTAAIGVGEKNYLNLKNSDKAFIDPKNRILNTI